jgi:hypothetical protein
VNGRPWKTRRPILYCQIEDLGLIDQSLSRFSALKFETPIARVRPSARSLSAALKDATVASKSKGDSR